MLCLSMDNLGVTHKGDKKMGIQFQTAFKLLKRNTSQNIFYFISAFVTSAIIFVTCNMLNNTFYPTLTHESMLEALTTTIAGLRVPEGAERGHFSTFSMLLFIALIYSLVLNYYTSQVFTNNYRRSITTLLLIGFSTSKAAGVLLIQYLILTIPAILLSFLAGNFFFIPLMDKIVYGMFNVVDPPIGVIYYGTYIIYASMVFAIVALFVMVQTSQIDALTVTDLLHKRVRTNLNFKNKIIETIVAKNYPLVYFIGIALFVFNWRDISIIPCLLIGSYSCFGILNYTIPKDCRSIKIKHPTVENYLVLSGYVTDLKQSFLSCSMLMVSVIVSVVLICQNNVSEMSCVLSVIALGAIIVMVCVSIFSQLFMGINERVEIAYRQFVLGIDRNRIININIKELVLFFMTLILVPGIYCVGIIVPSIIRGKLIAKYGILYLILLVVPLVVTMISTIIVFNNRIRSKLWKS